MKKSLQNQYNLIKEGKGSKEIFIKNAKKIFPNYVPNHFSFNETVNILKDKSLISENVISPNVINPTHQSRKESFEVAFEKFLKESQEEDEKAELKNPSKQVEEDLSKNFDREDKSNPDNLIFDQIMKGYYTEMCDSKNEGKTADQIKSIVFKNLEKNPIYYTEKGQFGIKDLGYTTEAPGLGTPKEPKGPHKSSGYGTLNEDHNPGDKVIYKGTRYEVVEEDETTITLKDEKGNVIKKNYNQFKKGEYKGDVKEQLLRKIIRESVEKEIAAINKEAELEILDSKLEKINAAIEKRQSQLTRLDEDEDMKALTDKNKVKQIQKDIKTLEKAKAKIEKQLSKKDKVKKEVIDEDEPIEEAIDDQKVDKVKTSLKDIDSTVDSIKTKTKDMFESEEELPQDIINVVVEKFAETGGDNNMIPVIAASFPSYEKEIVEFLEGYDLGLDYDI